MKTDEISQFIALIDSELSDEISGSCRDTWSTCPQKPEVERRIEAAHAALAKDRWRPVPCYFGLWMPERNEPGCEPAFSQFDVDFENARLHIAHQGRVLVNARKPTWAYRDPSPTCRPASQTGLEAFAFDPETGIVVLMLKFWATFEGCSEPPWDFHAIPLPALRRKAQVRDGGAP